MSITPPSKVATSSPVTLPEELIGEVLSFLKVKSLMRMKCVNKSWNTLISDPIFVKKHLMRSPRNTHLVVCSSASSYSANIFRIPISAGHLLKSWERIITLTDDPYHRFHSKNNIQLCIVGSCNGLICLFDVSTYYTTVDVEIVEYTFYFWNPATRTKSEKLGCFRSCVEDEPFMFTFGYDNSTDTYKVVLLHLEMEGKSVVKVFTLGDNVWRDINCLPVVLVSNPYNFVQWDGVYFSNSVNWLVPHKYNCHVKNLTIKEYVIVSLDLGPETYSQLLLPRCFNDNPFESAPTLFVFMDCLCFSYDFKKG